MEKLRHVDRVHLCRNVAGTEEGCEHFQIFQEYGVVKMFNPECFTTAQCRCWQSDLELDEYNPPSGTRVTRLVGKLKEYAFESEAEDTVKCLAGSIRWHGENGIERLPQQQRELDGNSLSTLAAELFEVLVDAGAFPVCESSASSGRGTQSNGTCQFGNAY